MAQFTEQEMQTYLDILENQDVMSGYGDAYDIVDAPVEKDDSLVNALMTDLSKGLSPEKYLIEPVLKQMGVESDKIEDVALIASLMIPGSKLNPKKFIKGAKKALKSTKKGIKKAKDVYGKTIGKGTLVNTGIRKTLNQFVNPLWAGPTGTYLGRNKLARLATAPNILMGAQLWKEPFSERTIDGPFADLVNLLQESRADYYTSGKAGQKATSATQSLFEMGGDKEAQIKRKERVDALVNKHFGIKEDKEKVIEDKKQVIEDKEKVKKFKIDWSDF